MLEAGSDLQSFWVSSQHPKWVYYTCKPIENAVCCFHNIVSSSNNYCFNYYFLLVLQCNNLQVFLPSRMCQVSKLIYKYILYFIPCLILFMGRFIFLILIKFFYSFISTFKMFLTLFRPFSTSIPLSIGRRVKHCDIMCLRFFFSCFVFFAYVNMPSVTI